VGAAVAGRAAAAARRAAAAAGKGGGGGERGSASPLGGPLCKVTQSLLLGGRRDFAHPARRWGEARLRSLRWSGE